MLCIQLSGTMIRHGAELTSMLTFDIQKPIVKTMLLIRFSLSIHGNQSDANQMLCLLTVL